MSKSTKLLWDTSGTAAEQAEFLPAFLNSHGNMMRNVLRTYIMFASRAQIIILTFLLLPTGLAEGAQPTEPKGDGQKPKTDLYGDLLPAGALARMGTARLRHGRGSTVAFAADGKTLITFGGDRTLRFWDVATGRQVRER